MEKKILREGKEVGTMIQKNGKWIMKEEIEHKLFDSIEPRLLASQDIINQMEYGDEERVKNFIEFVVKDTMSQKADLFKIIGKISETMRLTIFYDASVIFSKSSTKIMIDNKFYDGIRVDKEEGRIYLGFTYHIDANDKI